MFYKLEDVNSILSKSYDAYWLNLIKSQNVSLLFRRALHGRWIDAKETTRHKLFIGSNSWFKKPLTPSKIKASKSKYHIIRGLTYTFWY